MKKAVRGTSIQLSKRLFPISIGIPFPVMALLEEEVGAGIAPKDKL